MLDPRLPGGARFSFQRLRACSDVPVVMISPLADDQERTWGLQLGADDYVPSPLCADELVARVRSVLRRVRPLPHPDTVDPMTPARLELDDASRRVRVGDAWIALTAIEFRLFAFLAAHPAHAFRREELLEAVWGYTVGDDGAGGLVGEAPQHPAAEMDQILGRPLVVLVQLRPRAPTRHRVVQALAGLPFRPRPATVLPPPRRLGGGRRGRRCDRRAGAGPRGPGRCG